MNTESYPHINPLAGIAGEADTPPEEIAAIRRPINILLIVCLVSSLGLIGWSFLSEVFNVYVNTTLFYTGTFICLASALIALKKSHSLSRENITLHEQANFYQALIDAQSEIGQGMIIMERDSIIFSNEAFSEIAGYSTKELSALPSFMMLIAPDKRGVLSKQLQQEVSHSNKPHRYETAILHKEGQLVELEISIQKFYANDRVRLLIVAHDISKRKQIERAKSEFVSWVSHQLKSPLTASNYLIEMLLDGDMKDLTADQRPAVQKISESNDRMINLIQSLLNLSRLELGTFVVEPSPVNLPEVCQDVISELQPKIVNKDLTVTSQCDSESPIINTDKQLLRIVLQNLTSNAIKYTPTGSVTITCNREGPYFLIKVADTGMGIPRIQHHQIFSKLFRAKNAQDSEIEGTGLGLYIIKQVVQKLGGTIWFESEEGAGTTFSVRLPLKYEQTDASKDFI